MFDVITFGSATVDAFAKAFSELIKIYDQNGQHDLLAFPAGSKFIIDELNYELGGGGTNTAVAFKKLGLKTAYVGKVGQGINGERIITALQKVGVNTDLIKKGKKGSGFSIILDNPQEKDRVILTHKGINDDLKVADFKLSNLKTKWIYASSLVGDSFETLKKVALYAKKNNIKFAFNPSSYMTTQGLPYLREILQSTELLVFNDEEAKQLTARDKFDEIFQRLHLIGIKTVVITLGKKGVIVSHEGFKYKAKSLGGKVADTTGAGDSFAASFTAGLIRKRSIEDSIKMGLINATSVVGHTGAKEGLLTLAQVKRKMRGIKITKVKARY